MKLNFKSILNLNLERNVKATLLAIASILTTVLLLSQTALAAAETETGSGTNALTTPDPNEERRQDGAAATGAGFGLCPTCETHLAGGRMKDHTNPGSTSGTSSTPTESTAAPGTN